MAALLFVKHKRRACRNSGILSACRRKKPNGCTFTFVLYEEESSHRDGEIGRRDRTAALWTLEMELRILPTDPIPLSIEFEQENF